MEKLPGRERVGAMLSIGVVNEVDAWSNDEMGVINPWLMCSGSSIVTEVEEESSSSSPLGLGPRFIV